MNFDGKKPGRIRGISSLLEFEEDLRLVPQTPPVYVNVVEQQIGVVNLQDNDQEQEE
jgi:hypothetical protein